MLVKRPIKNIHIYVLKDPETDEIRYVGKTKVNLEQRLKEHLREKRTNHKSCWIKSLKTRNLKPIIESIEKVSDETWQEREIYWIQYYKELGCRLTNSNDGGEGSHNPCAETRAKMSAAKKNISDETRAKLSTAGARRKHTAESIAKMSASHKNMSAETKAKIGEISRNMSAESRARIGAAHKGKKISAETKAKLLAANLGKKHSAETKAKIANAQKIIAKARYDERAYSFLKPLDTK